jgi:hypothetical protein
MVAFEVDIYAAPSSGFISELGGIPHPDGHGKDCCIETKLVDLESFVVCRSVEPCFKKYHPMPSQRLHPTHASSVPEG